VGDASDAPLAGQPDIKTIRFSAHTLEEDLKRHPEIAMLQRQVEVAETDAQLAKANKRADWSVEVAYQQRGPAYANMFSVGVAIPLQWDQKNRQDREVASKLALADRAKAQQEDALRIHVTEVRTMFNEWENGQERITRYERELVPLAQDRTRAALAAYRGGKGDLNAVLGARRNEIEVRTQALQLEMDTARAWAQLNFLVPGEDHSEHADATAPKEQK
jgi:outer membrane protein TolC